MGKSNCSKTAANSSPCVSEVVSECGRETGGRNLLRPWMMECERWVGWRAKYPRRLGAWRPKAADVGGR